MIDPFNATADDYTTRDWPAFPLPSSAKHPPPEGATGWDAINLPPDRYNQGQGNIGIRAPIGVIGIDVDHYEPKAGATHLRKWMAEHGLELEPTWCTTRRELPSGIYWYRIPEGLVFKSPCPDVDLIQAHHRYAVMPPSVVEGAEYRWIHHPTREIGEVPPYVDELPWLPPAWVTEIVAETEDAIDRDPVTWGPTDNSETHPAVTKALGGLVQGVGSRHDTALAPLLTLTRLEAEGYPGATAALVQAEARYVAWIGDRSDEAAAQAEWDRMASGAQRRVANSESTIPPFRPPASLMDRISTDETKPDYGDVDDDEDPLDVIKSRLIYGTDLLHLPEPEKMVDDWLDQGMTWAMIGKQSSGKTFFALYLALSIVTGRPWFGKNVSYSGPVLYVAAEGAYTLGPRLRGWQDHTGTLADKVNDFIVYPTNFDLLRFSAEGKFDGSDALELLCHDLQPALVVLDTLNRSMPSGDENASADMGTVFAVMDRIRKDTGASVGVLHHTGVSDDGRSRGHSSLEGNIDVKLLAKAADDGTFKLSSEKQKTREIGAVIHARLDVSNSSQPMMVETTPPEIDSPWSDPRVTETKVDVIRAMRLHRDKTMSKADWCSKVVGAVRTVGIAFDELCDQRFFESDGLGGWKVSDGVLP